MATSAVFTCLLAQLEGAMAATGAEMITLLNSGPSIEFRPAEGLSFDVFLDDIRKAGIRRNVTQVRPQPFWYAEAKREHS